MQSPAKPYGCRGYVTATKHIGLDSFRVRNCDPDTDGRPPIHRASPCWNDGLEFGCDKQPPSFRAPSRTVVAYHDCVRSRPFAESVESLLGFPSPVAFAAPKRGPRTSDSGPLRNLKRSSSYFPADSTADVIVRTDRPFGLVRANYCIASFSDLFSPHFFSILPWGSHLFDDAAKAGFRRNSRIFVATTCSKNGLRTHFWKKVSDEKRNVDERPPTRGKSNCHR